MKKMKFMNPKTTLLLGLVFMLITSCERGLSDDAQLATFDTNPDVFIDGFVGGLEYQPFGDSFQEAFSVDTDVKYLGSSSMRFDIPAFGIGYGGANFPVSSPRNISGYDALTFWAKSLTPGDINEIGFGINGDNNNKYQVTRNNMPITTQWRKYIIPIPDATPLTAETGLFWYAEGARSATDNVVNTFWIDELRYEKLGNIAQPRPSIFNGTENSTTTFNGSRIATTGLTQTLNVGSGEDVTTNVAASYFTFNSSDTSVATVDSKGLITIISQGSAIITGALNGVDSQGSLTINSLGDFPKSPVPTRDSNNVLSIFSDAYINATESNFNPGFGGSTTQSSLTTTNGDNLQSYTSNNFTGILFNSTINASTFTMFHVDVFTLIDGSSVGFQIRDVGANQMIESDGGGNPIVDDRDLRFNASRLRAGEWTSFDIPLTGNIRNQKNNLGAIILVGGPDFILDNIYFYK
jgi:hypothetical protein